MAGTSNESGGGGRRVVVSRRRRGERTGCDGECFDAVLDRTVAYPGGAADLRRFLRGDVPCLVLRGRLFEDPGRPRGADHAADAAARAEALAWMNGIWDEKDALPHALHVQLAR